MATPQENIATLEAALGAGTAEVEYQGRRIKYSTEAQIRAAIAYFQKLIAAGGRSPADPVPASGLRTSFAEFSGE